MRSPSLTVAALVVVGLLSACAHGAPPAPASAPTSAPTTSPSTTPAPSASAQPTPAQPDIPLNRTAPMPLFDVHALPATPPPSEGVARVARLLSAHEYTPDADALRAACAAPADALTLIAADTARPMSIRLRAFESLAFVADDRVRTLYQRALEGASTDSPLFRHKAITAYARRWPDDAPRALGPLLDDDDPQLRLSAASALHAFTGDPGRALIDARVKSEPVPWVRDKLLDYRRTP